MTDQTTNAKAWRRITRLRWLYGLRQPATWIFLALSIANLTRNRYFNGPIGTPLTIAQALAALIMVLGIHADRQLLRASCPDCGDRLFARLPPKHPGEEYLDQMSPSCANCGVSISSHAL